MNSNEMEVQTYEAEQTNGIDKSDYYESIIIYHVYPLFDARNVANQYTSIF